MDDVPNMRIVEQAQIIDADSDTRIWVNAGPGTGKTYTVIQRLKKLLQEDYEGAIVVSASQRTQYR